MDRDWIYCPICNSKTRVQIQEETVMKRFPLFCPRCKKETLIGDKCESKNNSEKDYEDEVKS